MDFSQLSDKDSHGLFCGPEKNTWLDTYIYQPVGNELNICALKV